MRFDLGWYWFSERNAFRQSNRTANQPTWQFWSHHRFSQKQDLDTSCSDSGIPVGAFKRTKRRWYSIFDFRKNKAGWTTSNAISISEDSQDLQNPKSAISSAPAHLCYGLHCTRIWCKNVEWTTGSCGCMHYLESLCVFVYADEARICKTIDAKRLSSQNIVWKSNKYGFFKAIYEKFINGRIWRNENHLFFLLYHIWNALFYLLFEEGCGMIKRKRGNWNA